MAPSRAVVRLKLKSITIAPHQGKPDPSFSAAHRIPIASRLLFLASTPVPPPASRSGMDANGWEDTDPNVSARRQPDNGFLPSGSPSFGALAPLRPLQNHSKPYSPSALLADASSVSPQIIRCNTAVILPAASLASAPATTLATAPLRPHLQHHPRHHYRRHPQHHLRNPTPNRIQQSHLHILILSLRSIRRRLRTSSSRRP
jgi:hypothetical protein